MNPAILKEGTGARPDDQPPAWESIMQPTFDPECPIIVDVMATDPDDPQLLIPTDGYLPCMQGDDQ